MPARRRRAGREDPAEVAEPGRPEQRVGHRVERHVAVGVTVKARRARRWRCRRGRAARRARTGWASSPKPTRDRRPVRAAASSARPRSSGVVTLRFVASPGIAWTSSLQASSREASSVHVPGAVGRVSLEGRPEERAADPLGRLGRRQRSIDRPSPTTRPPSTRFTVSTTGTTGIAAPWRGGRGGDPLDEVRRWAAAGPRRGRGRPGRCVRGRPDRCRPSRASRAARPAATDSWRRVPPRDDGHDAARAATPRSGSGPRTAGATTTTIRPTTGAAASASRVQARSGRPPIADEILSTPAIRLDAPAATTSASALPAGARSASASGRPGAVNRAVAGRRSSARRRSGARG